MSRLSPLAAFLLFFGAGLSAQTTHTVQLFGTSFAPANRVITVGDTVLWDWVVGTHNVESGTIFSGFDGNFSSGSVVSDPATTYAVTFDAAFLAAHPMPQNTYPYFCILHAGLGMTGTITVDVPATTRALGCGVNPAGSIAVLAGVPQPGTSMTFGIDNPSGTQAPGSVPFLAISLTSLASDPCGVVLPGFGMAGNGELLVGLGSALVPPLLVGAPWTGAGSPAPIVVQFPNDSSLVGREVYAQGLLLDPGGTGPRFGLTDGFGLLIGN